MLKPEIPHNEQERLAQLAEYNIFDAFTEKDYDDITLLAAAICKTPVSLITLVDDKKQWFLSKRGIDQSETAREYAFCAHALNKPEEILIVPDSRKDKRFEGNPLVENDPHVIFYTGVPLVNPDGFALGTLCVIDHKPRELNEEQVSALKVLAKQVSNLLELRKINLSLEKARNELEIRNKELEQFASVLSHDIKSPLTSIIIAKQILTDKTISHSNGADAKWFNIIQKSVEKIDSIVNGVLAYYKDDSFSHNLEKNDLTKLISSLIPVLPATKKVEINYPQDGQIVFLNKTQLEQIFLNLLNNSIRYNDKEAVKIDIGFTENDSHYIFSVSDNGIGIAKADYDKIFHLFTSLPSKDETLPKGYGIGLSTVKKIVDRNSGTIEIDSKKGKGSVFTFTIKKQV